MNKQCRRCGGVHMHYRYLTWCKHCIGECRQRKSPRDIPFEHRTPEEQLQVDLEDIRGDRRTTIGDLMADQPQIKTILPANQVIPRFRRFADNWGVPVTADTLKMFLACATDSALWRADREEVPDDEWGQFVSSMTQALMVGGQQ